MRFEPAPFFEDMAGGSPGGGAVWAETSDGVRIRLGHWCPKGARGTVLLFPGRTEYIEKYSDTATTLSDLGFATLAVDWRGQGLADRPLEDRRVGHVDVFQDYQNDVAAVLEVARHLDLPRPWHLLAHSMGGAIGLRAVMDGLPVQSCAFTGPMWGIYMSPVMKPLGWAISQTAEALGLGQKMPPGSNVDGYVLVQPFEGNLLTTDPDMYKMMQDQLVAHPELSLGGPSLIWLRESLLECRELSQRPSPDLPCLTFLGDQEKIVDSDRIRERMAIWPRGELVMVPGAEHEVLMETPAIRADAFDRLVTHFTASWDGNNT